MAIRGQRFHVDLDSGDEGESGLAVPTGFNILGDIKERATSSSPRAPSPPRCTSSATGFPAHKTRIKPSKFNRNSQKAASDSRLPQNLLTKAPPTPNGNHTQANGQKYDTQDEGINRGIDEENKQRLAQMSEDEIEAARQELVSGLSPSLIEKLLRKANIDEGRTDLDTDIESTEATDNTIRKSTPKKVTFEEPEPTSISSPAMHHHPPSSDPDLPPLHPPPDLQPASSSTPLPLPPEFHFPKAPVPPSLDPSDPNFLSKLHSTYFPSLPTDPSALSWMAPIEETDESSYSPSHSSLAPSALRFDFRGHLLPPRLASQISSTKGLHHHAHAPESAGYTVPELAHLARSAISSQRCIAYQTLGRILYRLGRGDFGREGDDLCEALWGMMDEGRVIEGMVEAAGREHDGNRSIWVTATEAVWLWRKGGGRRWKGR